MMADLIQTVERGVEAVVTEWIDSGHLKQGDLFVVGCSTSEVAGSQIGTSGNEEIAAVIFKTLTRLKEQTGVQLIFQCCEHLNRSLVMEKETMQQQRLDEVAVIPVRTAGGSMATFAYKNLNEPVVVETVQANSGMDIGETMIGMHLRQVAVPIRFEQRMVGDARVTTARTRPKLIGGKRAVYEDIDLNNRCT
ncbi:TIGR01440 family protein [Virgibacillus sp. L01]|uniref:TIGR01440 family protein n=1 Tax=Virgibacillus sp. L01 TaxID=3457429 RepID=UPI003FD0EEF8